MIMRGFVDAHSSIELLKLHGEQATTTRTSGLDRLHMDARGNEARPQPWIRQQAR